MRVLVTGAGGFIGGNLALKLKEKGHTVYGFDNFSSSNKSNWPKGIIDNFRVFNVPKVKAIFHLGMASSSPMYRRNPYIMNKVITSTLDVLEKAKNDECLVVYASSSSLYNGQPTPQYEGMDVYVKDYYTETRLFIERLFELYFERFDVPSWGLRLFSVFGPRDENKGQYANMITQFILDVMKNRTPVIYGNGSQTRDFIHVDWVVKSFLKAWNNHKEHESGQEIVNVGTGIETSFNDIYLTINHILKKNIKPRYIKNPIKNYVNRTCADIDEMKYVLGVDPKDHNLPKLIAEHIEYLKRR